MKESNREEEERWSLDDDENETVEQLELTAQE